MKSVHSELAAKGMVAAPGSWGQEDAAGRLPWAAGPSVGLPFSSPARNPGTEELGQSSGRAEASSASARVGAAQTRSVPRSEEPLFPWGRYTQRQDKPQARSEAGGTGARASGLLSAVSQDPDFSPSRDVGQRAQVSDQRESA